MTALYVGWCDVHGKGLYPSRRAGRRLIRMMCWRRMRPYRCTQVDGMWHVGHKPKAVVRGRYTADQVFGGQL